MLGVGQKFGTLMPLAPWPLQGAAPDTVLSREEDLAWEDGRPGLLVSHQHVFPNA